MNCHKCGNELNPNMKFCAKCGTPVVQQAATQQPVQQKPAAPVVAAQPKPVAPEQNKETAQYQPIPMAPAPQQAPAKQQKPQKQKKGKKNLALKITAIVLAIIVFLTGGLFITDAILFKVEADKEGYITDFPVLKQKTELLVYDAEKFPYEEYSIKIDRFTTGKVFKSSTFSSFENVINERSDNPVFSIDFKEDGKYQITLKGIVSERTQAVTESTTKKEEPKAVEIIVIVDNDNEKAVDKVTINSKKDDKPIENFEDVSSSQGITEVQNITTISAGGTHTVALKNDGTVVAVGDNEYGQCDVGDWTDIVSVSAGYYHTVGLRSDGTVVASGIDGDDNGRCDVGSWTDIVAVSAGTYHTVGLKSDGTVVAVGSNQQNQCDISSWENIVAVSASHTSTVGLKNDGTVVVAGYLSDNERSAVDSWSDIIAVSAGMYHIVGLQSDGTVVATGESDWGQSNVSGWTDIVSVSAGYYHTDGLKSDGTVVNAMGESDYGSYDVSSWMDIVVVSAGYDYTVGLRSDGTVVAAGNNNQGQCNVSDWKDIRVPGKIDTSATPSTPVTPETQTPDNAENSVIENVKVGDYITFGKYEQDNNTSNGKEDVEWLILDVKDGKALVISKYALDCKPYDEDASTFDEVTWEICSLRNWLNNEFLNTAFSANEKTKISTVTVLADKNPSYDTNPGNATQDKVYLLSVTEANKYFGSDSARECQPTDYAVTNGVSVFNGNCWWWLRSPGSNPNCAVHVYEEGDINDGGYGVRLTDLAIRPAIWVTIN